MKIDELPYLAHRPTDGRLVPLIAYYDIDAKAFSVGLRNVEDPESVTVARGVTPIDAVYLSKKPAAEMDCHLSLGEIILQHFCFKNIWSQLETAQRDLKNILASMHKYFVFLEFDNRNEQNGIVPSFMMQTEIEYVFVNYRSFYDLLNRIAGMLYKKCNPKDSELPWSFHDVVGKKNWPSKYELPQPLEDFYKKREVIFKQMKEIRDDIIHKGDTMPWLVGCATGFAIMIDNDFAKKMRVLQLWPEGLLKPGRYGSVLAILEFLARDMLEAMKDLGKAYMQMFMPSPPAMIKEEYKLFLRSPFSKHLASLDEYRARHWFDPKEILGID